MECTLCKSKTKFFMALQNKIYYKCTNCNSILMSANNYMSSENEKLRYQEHNNDVYDKDYQAFVAPIVNAVLNDYKPEHKGLDFGAGTGPVITKMLKDKDYDIAIYDPFFANYKEKLNKKYDYIVCCEVMEHFHWPSIEFKKLRSMLKAGGSLYLKTKMYAEDLDFAKWYYKDDPTHVFFYHKQALNYIKNNYGFSTLKIVKNMIIYKV